MLGGPAAGDLMRKLVPQTVPKPADLLSAGR